MSSIKSAMVLLVVSVAYKAISILQTALVQGRGSCAEQDLEGAEKCNSLLDALDSHERTSDMKLLHIG